MPQSGCGSYLLGLVPNGITAKVHFAQYIVDARSESALKQIARDDARRYIYNAVVSFLGGIGGLNTQQAAWAVTRLYYSAFYIGRAALCRAYHIIFHAPKPTSTSHTHYELLIRVGQKATVVSKTPSTHKLVGLRFQEKAYPNFMTGLEVNGLDPFVWLMEQREYWQYRASRFPDPDMPDILAQVDIKKIQRLLEEYASDQTGLFLSDPEHALLAIPFRLVIWALSQESLLSPGAVTEEDLVYLRKQCHIGRQTLNIIQRLIV
jgi:hypothetical protein